MEFDLTTVAIILVIVIAFVIFVIRKNRKDQKELEQELNEKEVSPKKHAGDKI